MGFYNPLQFLYRLLYQFRKCLKYLIILAVISILFILLLVSNTKAMYGRYGEVSGVARGYASYTFSYTIDLSLLDLLPYVVVTYNPTTYDYRFLTIISSTAPLLTNGSNITYDASLGIPTISAWKYTFSTKDYTQTYDNQTWAGSGFGSVIQWSNYDLIEKATGQVSHTADEPLEVPYLANTYDELASLTTLTINVMPEYGTNVRLQLIDRTDSNKVLFDVPMSDYTDYLSRIDLSNPFSHVGYLIPISKLPSFTYTSGHTFRWNITFSFDNGQYNSSVYYDVVSTFTGSVGGGSGGNTGGTPGGVTPDDLQNAVGDITGAIEDSTDKVTGAIEDSTDRLLSDDLDESSMNIDTSVFGDVDTSSVFDLFYKMTDIIVASLVPSDDVYTITIPISEKYGGELVLRSDIISSHLPDNAFIFIFINAFWMYIFGRYMWQITFNVLASIKTGDILDGKLSVKDVITDALL